MVPKRQPALSGAALARALVAVLVLFVPVACSTPRAGPANASDESFLGMVHASDPGVGAYRSDGQLVRIGHAACDDFSAGAGYTQVADRLGVQQGPHPLPPGDLGAVITAALASYCPRYR